MGHTVLVALPTPRGPCLPLHQLAVALFNITIRPATDLGVKIDAGSGQLVYDLIDHVDP
jgi:hypothetical protein